MLKTAVLPVHQISMEEDVGKYVTVQKMRLVISLLAAYQTSHVVRSVNDTIPYVSQYLFTFLLVWFLYNI